MTIKLAVLMDPIESIDPKHDSSFAMLMAAQTKGGELYYFQQHDLFSDLGVVKAQAQQITLSQQDESVQLSETKIYNLSEFDVVLMRKDPPFNM
jgi:glutathione synthase